MNVCVIRPWQTHNLRPRLAVDLRLDRRRLVRRGARDWRQVAPLLHLVRIEGVRRPVVAQTAGAVFSQSADVPT